MRDKKKNKSDIHYRLLVQAVLWLSGAGLYYYLSYPEHWIFLQGGGLNLIMAGFIIAFPWYMFKLIRWFCLICGLLHTLYFLDKK